MKEEKNIYVGNRYVPKIMGEWSKQEPYEGLSIVTHEGTSYTSKKGVPIGVDIFNGNYWVVTGNYNAQIENYRNDVKSLKDTLSNDLNSRGYNLINSLFNGEDWTEEIQRNLDLYNHVFISVKGEYQVNGTINLKGNQILEIGEGVTLAKKITSESNLPVIWIKSSYAVLIGVNKMTSIIKSEKATPFGVVCLGYLGMNDTISKNVLYCTLNNLTIDGHTAGGNVTGLSSYALYLSNPQVDGLASYFHSIHSLYLSNANVGLMMEGWTNANIINDLQFYQVGNNKQTENSGAIVVKNTNEMGSLDNVITNIFHHTSPNADTLVLDGYVFYNVFTGINSEQGGNEARWIVEKNPRDSKDKPHGNIISGIDNVYSGSEITKEFQLKNAVYGKSFLSNNEILTKKITSDTVISKELSYETIKGVNSLTKTFNTENLKENASYKLLEVELTSNGDIGLIDFTILSDGTIDSFVQLYTGKLLVKRDFSGKVSIEKIDVYESYLEHFIAGISNNKVYIGFRNDDNGTSIKNISSKTFYNLKGNISQNNVIEYMSGDGII